MRLTRPLPSGKLIGQECIAAAAAERKKRKALVTEPTVAFKARSPTLTFNSVGCLTKYSVLGLTKNRKSADGAWCQHVLTSLDAVEWRQDCRGEIVC